MSTDETQVMLNSDVEAMSPFAIISDIHANLEALQAVLDDIAARGLKNIVCLGDVFGYGPDPVACWRLVRSACRLIIMGNHDQALVTMDMTYFHPRARTAIEWTRNQLANEKDGGEILDVAASLPVCQREANRFFVHGSPAGVTMDYLLPADAFDRARMRQEFAHVDGSAYNGHSHIPGVIEVGSGFQPPEALDDGTFHFDGRKAIINVGSVGQPRDNNPRACYVTVERDRVVYHRIPYPVETTAQKIFDTNFLDPFLGRRLLMGR